MSTNNLQMQEILGGAKPLGMLLVLEVRKRSGKKPSEMARTLGLTRQAYWRLENKGQMLTLRDYFVLERVFVDAGCGTADEFQSLARRLAKKSE